MNLLISALRLFYKSKGHITFYALITETKKQFQLKPKRFEVLRTLMETISQSHLESTDMYEAMKNSRNHIRRSGRKIHG